MKPFLLLLNCGLLFEAVGAAAQTPAYRLLPPARAAEKAAVVKSLLRSGPMVGYAEMREVALWVQTTAPATAHIEYWLPAAPQTRWRTAAVPTSAAHGCTAHLIADKVEPGQHYRYALYLNGQPVPRPYPLEFQTLALWQWRTAPPDFTFALGSCTYVNEPAYDRPGRSYGGEYDIFTSIEAKKPDFMLWLGDNSYLREPDWNSRTGIYQRYSHSRAVPEMQPLLARAHNYAIWDDHDYGPNDSDRSFWNKHTTLAAFQDFWANPNYGQPDGQGIAGTFQWADMQFFLLDDRWFRSPDNAHPEAGSYLGASQLQWLLEALGNSPAAFKIVVVGGQVLNPAQVFENYSNYAQERAQLLQELAGRHIPGILFLSGDRHFTELTKLDRPGTYPLYDLTCSPLTSSAAPAPTEANTGRVPGTYTPERNFATIAVRGPANQRELKMTVFDHAGKSLWERTIAAAELK